MMAQAVSILVNLNNLDLQSWRHMLALDFGIRVVILIASGIEMIIVLVTVNGFNWIELDLRQTGPSLSQTIFFIIVAVILELINAFFINRLFFEFHSLNVYKILVNGFSNFRFCVICWALACTLFVNPMFAFTSINV